MCRSAAQGIETVTHLHCQKKILQGPPYISGHYISSHTDYKWMNLTTKFDMLGVLDVVNLQQKICGSIPKLWIFF